VCTILIGPMNDVVEPQLIYIVYSRYCPCMTHPLRVMCPVPLVWSISGLVMTSIAPNGFLMDFVWTVVPLDTFYPSNRCFRDFTYFGLSCSYELMTGSHEL
jgi:hypothetical protein